VRGIPSLEALLIHVNGPKDQISMLGDQKSWDQHLFCQIHGTFLVRKQLLSDSADLNQLREERPFAPAAIHQ
jgi:hypothetical protein